MGLASRLNQVQQNTQQSSYQTQSIPNTIQNEPPTQQSFYSPPQSISIQPSAPPSNYNSVYPNLPHQSTPIPSQSSSGFLGNIQQKINGLINTNTNQQPQINFNPVQYNGTQTSQLTQQLQKTLSINTTTKYYTQVKNRIDQTIQAKNLHNYYPQNSNKYLQILDRVSKQDFQAIAQKRGIPIELAFDLASLALYDIIIFLDDSSSMLVDENWNPSTEKIEDVNLIFNRIVDVCSKFDDDGIEFRTFNSSKEFQPFHNENDVNSILKNIKYSGGTPLGKMLYTKILEPFLYKKFQNNSFNKPLLVFIITDGVPDNKQEVTNTIFQCKDWLKKNSISTNSCSFMFAQVGKDQGASQYLKELDNDKYIGEDIDTIGNYEFESIKYLSKCIDLTPDLYLLQLMLGAVDPNYDDNN